MEDTTNVDVLIAPQVPWLPKAVKMCSRLRWLHLLSSGSERIFEWGLHQGIYWLSKSAGVNATATAEYALAAILYFYKQFNRFGQQQKQKMWHRTWLTELAGKKAAIIGLGHVGCEIAKRCVALGVRVYGVSKRGVPACGVSEVFTPADIQFAVKDADFLVVALPLTQETRGLIGRPLFTTIKRGAILVDVSRGGVIEEESLVEALSSGYLSAAALDVFSHEPLRPNSELWNLQNVLITPHVAGTSDRFMEHALNIFKDNFISLTTRGLLSTPVDRTAGY